MSCGGPTSPDYPVSELPSACGVGRGERWVLFAVENESPTVVEPRQVSDWHGVHTVHMIKYQGICSALLLDRSDQVGSALLGVLRCGDGGPRNTELVTATALCRLLTHDLVGKPCATVTEGRLGPQVPFETFQVSTV